MSYCSTSSHTPKRLSRMSRPAPTTRREFRRPRRTRAILTALAVLSSAAVVSACTSAPPPIPAATDDPILGHIHALDFDAESKLTYASAHNGVWVVPTDVLSETYLGAGVGPTAATRVAGRAQDTMGFTVARPGLLLGSGHPDPDEQPELIPPNLGLIASTDGAETWASVSLRGQTDFHDLETAELPDGELRIFGLDASESTVLVSDDTGGTWHAMASIQARDLAADPQHPDRLYATTAEALVRSEDAGATFTPVPDAPPLYLVTVADSGEIIGIDIEGVIHDYDGTTWTALGRTDGVPEAFAYIGGGAPWMLIADQRGLIATDDFGETVTTLLEMAG